ncbi:PREDICTED: TIMELESS-interacting protein-like [Branchiostoma belcheri]|uniref:TIMELESS-interacting protein n=1 Tax=Branchiostoma belcheri TaxID=7741 RepID=A0A6P5A5S7_BRABE|nr:PREDICTED: TIMELESS-interacting protein-like [Branchiostoma belcheri]
MANIMDPDIMDSLFDMPEYEEDDDDFPPLPPPLPPLSPAREDGEDGGQGDAMANGEDTDDIGGKMLAAMEDVPMAGKKSRRKPQPKLDAKRLCGERGIPSLPKHFDKVKFAGKGHEAEDLKLLMRTMEHWAHRLFPKLTFDDVIEKVEQLGQKKPVQVCMEKLRMGMPLLDEDFVRRGDDEDQADEAGTGAGTGGGAGAGSDTDSGAQPPSQPGPSQSTGLTAEQREKMEQNRRLAEERRKARLQAMQQAQEDAIPGPSSAPDDESSAMDTSLGSDDFSSNKGADDVQQDIQPPAENMETSSQPVPEETSQGDDLHISHNAPDTTGAAEPDEDSNEGSSSNLEDNVNSQSKPSDEHLQTVVENNTVDQEPVESNGPNEQASSDDEDL